jgi:hypothetical protein
MVPAAVRATSAKAAILDLIDMGYSILFECSHRGLHAYQSEPERIGFETLPNYLVSGLCRR